MTVQTMLVVDDSRLTRMMVKNFVHVAHPEWKIIEAGSGEEALQKVNGEQIDWMTIDLNMPGIDGMELAEQLKDQFPQANMCLLTANVQKSVQQRASKLGISFVSKPITEEKIVGYVS
ncbi:MAG: response regulator [Gammaproteobacteria bacterium]|nr:response regulator [Gammaproteobacteria bacterium]